MAETARFFIFHGEDEFTQSETLADLKSRMGDPAMVDLNTSYFEGRTVTLGELMHACNTLPFLASKRLVMANELIEHLSNKGREQDRKTLLEYLPNLPPTTRLFFIEKNTLSANNPFIKLAATSPIGFSKAFQTPKGSSLENWISKRVQAHGGTIHPFAAALLASDIGDDLRLLEMEIAKLLAYVKYTRPIQTEDIELLTPYAAQADIFALVDAIGQRHGQKAAILLHKKLKAGNEPLYLLAMIIRQVRLLVQIKERLGQQYRPDEIARDIKIHPYVASKLSQQAGSFSLPQLEAIHRKLLDVDIAIKTGRIDPAAALELLVAESAGS